MSNVVQMNWPTRYDISPETVLEAALDKLQDAVVIGYDKEGEFYFASSKASGPEVLWLLELAKTFLIDIGKGDRDAN